MTQTSQKPQQSRYWVRSSFIMLMERGLGLAFAFGKAVILLRMLPKEAFAAWGLFLLITYFLEVGRNGLLQNGLVRHLALHRHEQGAYAAISTAALALNFAFSVVSDLLLWAISGWMVTAYQVPALAELLPVYLVTNFVMAFLYHFNFVQQANFEFRGVFWGTLFFRGTMFAYVFYCWFFQAPFDLYNLALFMLCGAGLGAMASGIFALPHLALSPTLQWEWVKKLAGYGKYVLGTNLATMLGKNTDKLMLGPMLGPAAFAVYEAASRLTQIVEAPSFSIAPVIFPQSTRVMAQEGPEGIRRLYERSVGALLALILPFLVLAVVFAEPLMVLFAGEGYRDAAYLLRFTAFFGLFLPFSVQFGTILDSTGRPATNFAYTLFTAVINLGLTYVFIRALGLPGAAIAMLVGYAISFLLMQHRLNVDFGVRFWRSFLFIPTFYRMFWGIVHDKLRPAAAALEEPSTAANTQPNN